MLPEVVELLLNIVLGKGEMRLYLWWENKCNDIMFKKAGYGEIPGEGSEEEKTWRP